MYQTQRILSRRAFTLMELLTVLAIIVMLTALVLPTLQGAMDQGRSTKCVSNQHQIYIAALNHNARNLLEGVAPFVPEQWVAQATRMIPDGGNVFICPKERNLLDVALNAFEGDLHLRTAGGLLIPLVEGPRAQLQATYADGYQLGFEDWTDNDFQDVVLDIRFDANGQMTITIVFSETGGNFDLIDLVNGSQTVLWPDLKNQVGQTQAFENGISSYALSNAVDKSFFGEHRIFLLDYERSVASVTGAAAQDDWTKWVNSDGTYSFARHFNRVNALMADGSHQMFDPAEINPDVAGNLAAYWEKAP